MTTATRAAVAVMPAANTGSPKGKRSSEGLDSSPHTIRVCVPPVSGGGRNARADGNHPTRRGRRMGPSALRVPGREGAPLRLASHRRVVLTNAAALLRPGGQDAEPRDESRGVRLGPRYRSLG